MKFVISTDTKGEFRFKLVSKNGETVAVSEGYKTLAMCKKGIAAVKKCAKAKVVIE